MWVVTCPVIWDRVSAMPLWSKWCSPPQHPSYKADIRIKKKFSLHYFVTMGPLSPKWLCDACLTPCSNMPHSASHFLHIRNQPALSPLQFILTCNYNTYLYRSPCIDTNAMELAGMAASRTNILDIPKAGHEKASSTPKHVPTYVCS